MAKSRKKQNDNITRIVGILFLELIAAILLLNLVAFAQQQRSENDVPSKPNVTTETLAAMVTRRTYPYPESTEFTHEKSLPKLAAGRYNVGW